MKFYYKSSYPRIRAGSKEFCLTALLKQTLVGLLMLIPCFAYAGELDPGGQYNWSGFYLGGFAGGTGGTTTNTTEPLRLDNGNYWFRPFNNSYGYSDSSSFLGGATLGYNWQVEKSPLLLGLEGEYGYLYEHGSGTDINQTPYGALVNNIWSNTGTHSTNIGGSYGYGLIGGRIGYAMDCLLLYVKGGALFTNIKTFYGSTKTEDNITPNPQLYTSGSNNIVRYGVGGGIEYALPLKQLDNISVKVEYLYLGTNSTQSTYGYCSCHFLWTTTDVIGGVHTVKLGVNYKFWGLSLQGPDS